MIALLPAGCLTTRAGMTDAGGDSAEQKSTPSLQDRQYLLGDWGGTRTRLAEEGVTFDLTNIGDPAINFSGREQIA
ncbi:MAG: hypothetical protein WDN28_07450 [Chthoniobacter sp.]